MQVTLALIADYANVTREGKLNILGIFDRINVAQLPAVHPQMQFVLRLDAHPAETGRAHKIEIKLHDPDGQSVFDINGEMRPHGAEPGETVSSNQIITLNNLQLETTGEYTFVVFIDNDLKAQVPLRVQQAEGGPGGAASGGMPGPPIAEA